VFQARDNGAWKETVRCHCIIGRLTVTPMYDVRCRPYEIMFDSQRNCQRGRQTEVGVLKPDTRDMFTNLFLCFNVNDRK